MRSARLGPIHKHALIRRHDPNRVFPIPGPTGVALHPVHTANGYMSSLDCGLRRLISATMMQQRPDDARGLVGLGHRNHHFGT